MAVSVFPEEVKGLTLLSTTTLSGASTTVSGINQTYNTLFITITGATAAASGWAPLLQYNGVTSGYNGIVLSNPNGATAIKNQSGSGIAAVVDQTLGTGTSNYFQYTISNYSATNHMKCVEGYTSYFAVVNTVQGVALSSGQNGSDSAVTSITFVCNGSTFNAGTIRIFGVK
jgi:hypothetical protein